MIKVKMMCDRCLRVLGDNEPMFGFKLIDDEDNVKAFKGHEECIQTTIEILGQLYGVSEDEESNKNQE